MLSLGNKLTLNTQPIYHFVNKRSIVFDGVDDCIITDGADTVAQNTTYSFWCKSSKTTENKIFGHGGTQIGSFWFNSAGNLYPLLFVSANHYARWEINTAQDDGEWHHWVLYQDVNNAANCKLYCDGILQTQNLNASGSLTTYTESLTIGGTQASGGSYFEGNIDEFAVFDRELTQAEITRMYNTYYSPNRVANGNFSQIGNEEVTNGDFSQIGSELVTNGDFATDSDWSVYGNSTISNGKANLNSGTGAFANTLLQSSVVTNLKSYKISFTISNYQEGVAYISIGFNTSFVVNSDGDYTFYGISESGDNTNFIVRNGASNFIGSIDNVSVKEVGQDWSFGTGWSTDGAKALYTQGGSQYAKLSQATSLTNGSQYKVNFDLVDTNSLGLNIRLNSGAWSPFTSGTGSKELFLYAGSGSEAVFEVGNDYATKSLSIDNISVKEVGQGWTFGTGWSTDGTKAIFSGTDFATLTTTYSPMIIGRDYKLTLKAEVTNGSFKFQTSGVDLITSSTTGDYSATWTATTSVFTISRAGVGVQNDFTIDNVVIQELKHDATNLMLNAGAYQSANPLITSTNSMEFDGVDDYLSSTGRAFGTDNVSVACWINLDAWDNYDGVWSNRNNTGTSIGFQCRTDGTVGNVALFSDFGSSTVTSTATGLSTGKWHYVVCTMDRSGNQIIYVDGVAKDTDDISSHSAISMSNVDLPFFIGKDQGNAEADGNITEFGIWDRVLTSLEVASLYNQGMPTNLLVNRNDYQSGNPTVFNTKQVDFDGLDDFLDLGSQSGVLRLAGSNGSISAWINPEITGDNFQRIIDKSDGGNAANGYAMVVGNDGVVGCFINNSASIVGSTLTTANIWYHILWNWNGTNHNLYINGVLSSTASNSTTPPSDTTNMRIGSWNHASSREYNGKMSQIGIWNEALTADEVSSLYNHGLPVDLNTDQAAYTSSSNLVGYWRMGSGTLDSYPLIADQTNATLGSELVVNGDFATDSDWSKGTGWTIANGIASQSGGTGQLHQTISTTVGVLCKITFTANVTAGAIRIAAGPSAAIADFTTSGTYTLIVPFLGNTVLYILGSSASFIGTIDNVSVKQVNGNPAIMTNMTASDIENGSPYANVVQNGDFSEGTTDWTFSAQCEVVNDQARILSTDGSFQYISQNNVFDTGKNYKLEFDIISSNGATLGFSGGIPDIQTTTLGRKTIYTSPSTSYLQIKRSSGVTDVVIDNVTVEEVNTGLQGYWKMGSGINDEYPVIYDQTNPTLSAELVTNGDFSDGTNNWTETNAVISASNNQLTVDDSLNLGGDSRATQSFTTENGKSYILRFDRISTTSLFYLGIGNGAAYNNIFYSSLGTDTGSYARVFTALGTTSTIALITGGTGISVFSNVTVKEMSGNFAEMTNMVEGNITNQYPLTKIRNYYRMGDGILDGYPIIQDQTSPNLAHIPTTNNAVPSEVFSSWSLSNVTITTNTVVSPDGTQNASTITPTAVSGVHLISISGTNTIAMSVYAKQNGYTRFRFNSGSSGNGFASFNLATGVVAASGGTYLFDSGIKDVGNGWFRCFMVLRSGVSPNMTIAVEDNSGQVNYTGDGTSGIHLWGAQSEDQLQATAYLKSDGVASVRKATTTNLVTYSEDFNQSAWVKASMNFVSNIATSPDGTLNATSLTNTNTTQSHTRTSFVTATTGIYTGSAYLKKQDFDFVYVEFGNSYAWFNISNGTLGNTGNFGSGWTFVSHSIESVGNDWYRISITANNTTTGTYNFRPYQPTSSNGSYNSGSTGTSFIWGTQVEQQTQVETYAKTTGLPVTIDLFTENNYGTMTNMSASDIVPDTPNN